MQVRERFRSYREVVRGGWAVIAALSAVGGAYDFVSAQFFPDANLPTMRDVFGWWDWKVWLIIGLVVIVVALLEGTYRHARRSGSSEVDARQVVINAGTEQDIVHYHNRSELPSSFGEFDVVRETWVLWFTGAGAREHLIHQSGNIKRMILLAPDGLSSPEIVRYLKTKAKDRDPQKVVRAIKDISEEAYAKKVDVRWLDTIPPFLFVIHNPNGRDAWVRAEVFDLSRHAPDWESYKVYKATNNWLFSKLLGKYEGLWKASRKVTPSDFR